MSVTRIVAIVAIACALASFASVAHAHPYETFVDVESADDLADLAASGAIDDDTYETLDELLARGVELDRADRDALYALPNLTYDDVDAILAYRGAHGAIRDPAELTAVIGAAKLRAIRAFLVTRAPGAAPWDAHAFVAAQARWSQDDRGAPATMLRARVLAGPHVTAGLGAIVTRMRLGAAVWDADRGAILAEPPTTSLIVPKAYVRWQDDHYDAIIGSYRVGFGERLTFDDSYDLTPNGLYADDQIVRTESLVRACKQGAGELATTPCPAAHLRYVTPDYTTRESLFGAAIGARAIPLGRGVAQAYAWASYHRRSIYQYELYDAARCADPRAPDPVCGAPEVLVRGADRAAAAASWTYQTVPDVFREAVAGAHVGYAPGSGDPRTRVGLTGFAARTLGLLAGADLGYQEWANRPGASGDGFGAIGVDAATGRGALDLGAEVTRTFDAMHPAPGARVHGGGVDAAIVRATITSPAQVIEASLRWYGVDFVDPFAKPIAARDELEGQRARDEAGARVRYATADGVNQLRAQLDVWALPAERVPRTNDYVRLDHAIDAPVGWGVWLQYEDKDLGAAGRGQCFDSSLDAPPGELCKGMRVSTTARLHLNPSERVRVTAQLTHRLLDDVRHPDGFRHDVMAWAVALWRPNERLRVHARARYLFQDVATRGALEESLWTYADVTLRVRDRDALRVRADLYAWLDARASTLARAPNPELWLWLGYEASF